MNVELEGTLRNIKWDLHTAATRMGAKEADFVSGSIEFTFDWARLKTMDMKDVIGANVRLTLEKP